MKILGALFIAAGFILFAQNQIPATLISILIGSVFIALPRHHSSDNSDSFTDSDSADNEMVHVDAPLKRVQATSTDHRRLAFPVDGVTALNDDASSRQDILHRLCGDEDLCVREVWFDDYLFGGKVAIRVMTDEGCVGQIRQKDVNTVRSYFGELVRMIYLEISKKENTNGDPVYYADVVIIENTSPPDL